MYIYINIYICKHIYLILMSIVCISIYVCIRLPIHTHICIYGYVKIYHRCIIHICTHLSYMHTLAYTCIPAWTYKHIQELKMMNINHPHSFTYAHPYSYVLANMFISKLVGEFEADSHNYMCAPVHVCTYVMF